MANESKNESEKRFGIVRPPAVPFDAVALPPYEPDPTGSGVDIGELTVRQLAAQISLRNFRDALGYHNLIVSYRELRIDPPYPAPPTLHVLYALASSADAKAAGWGPDPVPFTHGIPVEFVFPTGLWIWMWSV